MTIILKLKSPDKIAIKLYLFFLIKILKKNIYEYKLIGLPTKRKFISLLKSPMGNKKAQEQFELKIFKKILIIKNKLFNKILPFFLINKPKNIKFSLKIKNKEK
jgi:ribosomal protein S10